MKGRSSLSSQTLAYLPMLFFTFIMGYPILWMVFSSFKEQNEIYTNIWGFPQTPQWSNYVEAWARADAASLFRNSLIVSFSTVILIVFLATLASYGIAKVKFRGSQFLYILFIIAMFVSQQILIVPLFRLMRTLNFINTYFSLIMPYAAGGLPLAIFIFTTYFRGIPDELVDAAKMDGCRNLDILLKIILPISGPAVSAVVIFEFLECWNEFFLALIFIQKASLRTLPLGVFAFSSRDLINYPQFFAVLSLAMLPILTIFLLFQRRFVSGLTAGALVE